MRIASGIGIGVCALATMACGSDDESKPAEEDPAEHACEQVSETGTGVTATEDRAAAPEISPSEEPYTVTLVAGKPSFVKISGGIDALLFTNAAGVVNAVYHEQGTTSIAPAPEPNEKCPSVIPEHFDLALDQSGSYYVELAPAAIPAVWIALTLASGHSGH